MSHENHDLNPSPISTICSNQNGFKSAKTKPFGALHRALLMPKCGSRVSPGGDDVFKILALGIRLDHSDNTTLQVLVSTAGVIKEALRDDPNNGCSGDY